MYADMGGVPETSEATLACSASLLQVQFLVSNGYFRHRSLRKSECNQYHSKHSLILTSLGGLVISPSVDSHLQHNMKQWLKVLLRIHKH